MGKCCDDSQFSHYAASPTQLLQEYLGQKKAVLWNHIQAPLNALWLRKNSLEGLKFKNLTYMDLF